MTSTRSASRARGTSARHARSTQEVCTLRVVRIVSAIGQLPNDPAIYAMYGGGERPYVAYVGLAGNLRGRVEQHLVRRDSSATTGVTAVGLHPEHVRAVEWWQHPAFSDSTDRAAAELVAFDVLEPALRSRGGINKAARERASEDILRSKMSALLEGAPTDRLALPSFAELAERVEELERRLDRLESAERADQS
jgi:hypothetical protein